jgi:hypothetical protein
VTLARLLLDPGPVNEEHDELAADLQAGKLILFTGAGFTSGACDAGGRELPSSARMIQDLWRLCFGAREPYDAESTLQDLYDVAVRQCPERLAAYLSARLQATDGAVAAHHIRFFAAPWRRMYTLNVDDLERAVARRASLPRPLRVITPWSGHEWLDQEDERFLDVVHLNGQVTDNPHSVTFSTLQYASRLTGAEPLYEALARELMAEPFVFVGTRLDEVILWQHLQYTTNGHDPTRRPRPRSYLVTPRLARARATLLAALNVEWLPMTAEEFARRWLAPYGGVEMPLAPRPRGFFGPHPGATVGLAAVLGTLFVRRYLRSRNQPAARPASARASRR